MVQLATQTNDIAVGIPWADLAVAGRILRWATERQDQNLAADGGVAALARKRRGHRLPLLQEKTPQGGEHS